MSLPGWLFDLLLDEDIVAIATAWSDLLDGAEEVDQVQLARDDWAPAVVLRARAMRARADAEHERVWMAGCECETPLRAGCRGAAGGASAGSVSRRCRGESPRNASDDVVHRT